MDNFIFSSQMVRLEALKEVERRLYQDDFEDWLCKEMATCLVDLCNSIGFLEDYVSNESE